MDCIERSGSINRINTMNDLIKAQKGVIDFIQHYVEEVRNVVTGPTAFFIRMKEESGFLEPTIFAAITILIPKLFYALLIAPITLGLSLIFVVPAVVYGICTLFVASIVLHGLVRLTGGGEYFEGTYRCVAYSSVAFYIWLIPFPFINLLLFTAVFCYLLFVAIREIHELNAQQAMLVLIFPGFIILLAGAILSIMAIWLMVAGFNTMLKLLLGNIFLGHVLLPG